MRERYPALVSRVMDSVLDGPGITASTLRRAVHDRAGRVAPEDPAAELPADVAVLVDKIAERAYDVADRDVDALRRAGYSEDAIFEIVVSAAIGAGRARLDRGLAALGGG